jgi:hypothetical protein
VPLARSSKDTCHAETIRYNLSRDVARLRLTVNRTLTNEVRGLELRDADLEGERLRRSCATGEVCDGDLTLKTP